MSYLPASCPLRSLSSQVFPPAAVAVVWPGASPSPLPDHCGNLSWGQSGQRAVGAWESGYSWTHNPALHFLPPPPLYERWAVVVQGVRGAGTGCGRGLIWKTTQLHDPTWSAPLGAASARQLPFPRPSAVTFSYWIFFLFCQRNSGCCNGC